MKPLRTFPLLIALGLVLLAGFVGVAGGTPVKESLPLPVSANTTNSPFIYDEARDPIAEGPVDGDHWEYSYDTDNQRVDVWSASGKRHTSFLWDGGRPIEEFTVLDSWITPKPKHGPKGDKDGKPHMTLGPLFCHDGGGYGGPKPQGIQYVWALGQFLEQEAMLFKDGLDGDTTTELGPGGVHLNDLRYSMADQIGSTRLLTNPQGGVIENTTWGPWGEPLRGGRKSRVGFTGHQYEKLTGHHYSVYRYLDPRNGRWTQRDPVRGWDGPNRYTYVRNRPDLRVDRAGLQGIWVECSPPSCMPVTVGELSSTFEAIDFTRGQWEQAQDSRCPRGTLMTFFVGECPPQVIRGSYSGLEPEPIPSCPERFRTCTGTLTIRIPQGTSTCRTPFLCQPPLQPGDLPNTEAPRPNHPVPTLPGFLINPIDFIPPGGTELPGQEQ